MMEPGERIMRLKKGREFTRKIFREGEQLLHLALIEVLLEEKVGESLTSKPCHVLLQLGLVLESLTQVYKNVKVLVFFTKLSGMLVLVILHCMGTRGDFPTDVRVCVCVCVCKETYSKLTADSKLTERE